MSINNNVFSSLQRASDYLSEQMKNTNGLLRLYAYWARLEQTMGKDTVSARSVWERLLKIRFTNFNFCQCIHSKISLYLYIFG